MKRLGIHAVALAAAISLVACRPGEEPPRATADPRVGVDERAGADMRDFVQRAAEKNMTEIELGRLAQERASDQQVRQFGQRMVDDHTKALDELRQIAARHNIQVDERLGDEGRRLQERLQGLKGAEFDRAYVREMVDAHERMHTLVENRLEGAPAYGGADTPRGQQPVGTVGQRDPGDRQPGVAEPPDRPAGPAADRPEQPGMTAQADTAHREIDEWASGQLPIIEQHHEQAQQIQQRLEKAAGAQR